MNRTIVATALCVALAGCSGSKIPTVDTACAAFRSAEASPRVQLTLAGAMAIANLAGFGGPAAIVTELRAYGSRFCAEGPPAGDVTTEPERVSWLTNITSGMLAAAFK